MDGSVVGAIFSDADLAARPKIVSFLGRQKENNLSEERAFVIGPARAPLLRLANSNSQRRILLILPPEATNPPRQVIPPRAVPTFCLVCYFSSPCQIKPCAEFCVPLFVPSSCMQCLPTAALRRALSDVISVDQSTLILRQR